MVGIPVLAVVRSYYLSGLRGAFVSALKECGRACSTDPMRDIANVLSMGQHHRLAPGTYTQEGLHLSKD